MYPEECKCELKEERTIKEILQENLKFIEEIKNISMENLDNLSGNGVNVAHEELCTNNIQQLIEWQNNDLKTILEIVLETNKKIGK